jgi:hypothetical protein
MSGSPLLRPGSLTLNVPDPSQPDTVEQRRGSHWDAAYAQSLGFKRATVGGVVLGHLYTAALDAWGRDWLEHGESHVRLRRPVYSDDQVAVTFSDPARQNGLVRSDVEVVTPDGEVAIVGWVGMREVPSTPSASSFPMTLVRGEPVNVVHAERHVGESLLSQVFHEPGSVESPPHVDYDPCRADARIRLKVFPRGSRTERLGIAPGTLVPWEMVGASAREDLDYTESNIRAVTETRQRFYNQASLDDRLTMHARIGDAFERRGSKYLVVESLVVANDTTPIVWTSSTRVVLLAPRDGNR